VELPLVAFGPKADLVDVLEVLRGEADLGVVLAAAVVLLAARIRGVAITRVGAPVVGEVGPRDRDGLEIVTSRHGEIRLVRVELRIPSVCRQADLEAAVLGRRRPHFENEVREGRHVRKLPEVEPVHQLALGVAESGRLELRHDCAVPVEGRRLGGLVDGEGGLGLPAHDRIVGQAPLQGGHLVAVEGDEVGRVRVLLDKVLDGGDVCDLLDSTEGRNGDDLSVGRNVAAGDRGNLEVELPLVAFGPKADLVDVLEVLRGEADLGVVLAAAVVLLAARIRGVAITRVGAPVVGEVGPRDRDGLEIVTSRHGEIRLVRVELRIPSVCRQADLEAAVLGRRRPHFENEVREGRHVRKLPEVEPVHQLALGVAESGRLELRHDCAVPVEGRRLGGLVDGEGGLGLPAHDRIVGQAPLQGGHLVAVEGDEVGRVRGRCLDLGDLIDEGFGRGGVRASPDGGNEQVERARLARGAEADARDLPQLVLERRSVDLLTPPLELERGPRHGDGLHGTGSRVDGETAGVRARFAALAAALRLDLCLEFGQTASLRAPVLQRDDQRFGADERRERLVTPGTHRAESRRAQEGDNFHLAGPLAELAVFVHGEGGLGSAAHHGVVDRRERAGRLGGTIKRGERNVGDGILDHQRQRGGDGETLRRAS